VLPIFISLSAVFIKNFDTSLKYMATPHIKMFDDNNDDDDDANNNNNNNNNNKSLFTYLFAWTLSMLNYELESRQNTNTESNTIMKTVRPRLKYKRYNPVLGLL